MTGFQPDMRDADINCKQYVWVPEQDSDIMTQSCGVY